MNRHLQFPGEFGSPCETGRRWAAMEFRSCRLSRAPAASLFHACRKGFLRCCVRIDLIQSDQSRARGTSDRPAGCCCHSDTRNSQTMRGKVRDRPGDRFARPFSLCPARTPEHLFPQSLSLPPCAEMLVVYSSLLLRNAFLIQFDRHVSFVPIIRVVPRPYTPTRI